MLTRLKVSGFKNLVDVDVSFGPFTCVAGANGVGKSNLFDAIHFLSLLADRPLIDAALAVRDEDRRSADVRSLFHRAGDKQATEMSFEAEMIVPAEGLDDLGQKAKASITFLRYSVTLALRQADALQSFGPLELIKEELTHITRGQAHQHLTFPHNVAHWRRTAVTGERRAPFLISTRREEADRYIQLHQDGGSSGRPLSRRAANLPRTVLSVANAAESPTALMARREMQSWRLLQLEPSSLRRPDDFNAPTRLAADGSHLAATLYHLARFTNGHTADETQLYGQVANRLSGLIDDVYDVGIDRDEKRELLTLQVTDRSKTTHSARALSDGTLRFLALSVLALEQDTPGLLCLEEPENGIHPRRIPAMLQLLQDIATDVNEPVGPDNPLRQVIINTHSPAVVEQVPDDSLLVADLREILQDGRYSKSVRFSSLPDTWRAKPGAAVVAKGTLLDYLNLVRNSEPSSDSARPKRRPHRVIDRTDIQQLLLPFLVES